MYVGTSVTTRFSEDLFNVPHDSNVSYLWYLVRFAAPWTQVFVFSVVPVGLFWRELPPRVRGGVGACASVVVLILAVFFAAATKAPTYLEPLYAFAAVALALALMAVMRRKSARMLGCVGIGLLLIVGASLTVYNGFHRNPYYGQTDELSVEEKAAGQQVARFPQSGWYVYGGDHELGSLMYYSGRTDPIALNGPQTPRVGDVIVLYDAQLPNFSAAYGQRYGTAKLYRGNQLVLLRVTLVR
jgi:hypothetical protein